MGLADPLIENNIMEEQDFVRMLTIGMLCVQDDQDLRPSSQDLVDMLENSNTTLPDPKEPPGVAPREQMIANSLLD